MAVTHSPDPVFLGPGAGSAAEQANRPRLAADHKNGSWVIMAYKDRVKPGDRFPNESAITAEDATNAAKLAGLGYVAQNPATAWQTGYYFLVTTYKFHWTGSAWAPGTVPPAAPQAAPAPPPPAPAPPPTEPAPTTEE